MSATDNIIKWPLQVSAYEILHSLPDAVVTTDRQMRVNYFNLAAARLTGFRPVEALGMYCKDVLKSDICETECLVKRALDSRRNVFNVETTITTALRDRTNILVNASLLTDYTGNIVGYMCVFRDIMQLKKMMVDLEKSRDDLERANEQLWKEIEERKRAEEERARMQAQLRHAQKMEAIGTLAGGVAHDFNNLLMAILGNITLVLLETDPRHSNHKKLKSAEECIKSAASLTSQLLGFARGGKFDVKPTDFNELVKNTVELFARTKKEIMVHTQYQENIWAVEADQSQFEQVMLNLLINAWQAMPGGGDIFIRTENFTANGKEPFSLQPGKYVNISVTDTGLGMDEATQERIFEPFFTTKEMGRGTGLGLASVYGTIKNHGGYISVDSAPGRGATFSIYLPASEQEPVREVSRADEVVKGSGTVLLVDDDAIIIDVGVDVLEHLGYQVMTAGSGEEAISLYEKNKGRIDIVLLDMIMPGMGGGKTFDRLKEINPDVRVLLLSGYSIDGLATKILNRGCKGFLQKPFKITDLSKKISEISCDSKVL
ncbi:MAG: hybrid sensor histidine kinase/response regulator [Thermodesulfobacteriota bacterium]